MILSPLLFAAAVALEPRCASVESVVTELAQKSGRPLGIRADLKNEVCFVHLQPHDAETLMRLLARALDAEWTEEAGRVLLTRSASLKRRLATSEQAAVTKEIAAWVSDVLTVDDGKATDDPVGLAQAMRGKIDTRKFENDDAGYQKALARLQLISPIGRLLSRTLRNLPAATLAATPFGETVRLTPNPHRQQLPLTLPKASLDQYVREHRVWAEKMPTLPEATRQSLDWFGGGLSDPGAGPFWPLLTAQRFFDGTVNVQFFIFNGRNEMVDQTWLTIASRFVPTPSNETWRAKTFPRGPALRSFADSLVGRPVMPAEAAMVRDPVAHEPLAILCGETFEALAEGRGGETIFPIPDEVTNNLAFVWGENLGRVDDGLATFVAFDNVDGVRVGHLRHPASANATKADRAALRDLLPAFAGHSVPSLDTLSAYLLRQNPEAGNTRLEYAVLSGAGYYKVRQHLSLFFDSTDGVRDLARVYGRMPVETRRVLWKEARIPFANLPAASQADLQRMLFHREFAAPVRGRLMDPGVYFDALPGSGWLQTVPGDPYPMVAQVPVTDYWDFIALTSLGYAKFRADREEALPPDVNPNGSFIPATTHVLNFNFWFQPKFGVQKMLSDTMFDPKAAGVPMSRLPAEHLKEIDRVLKALGGD